MASSISHRKKYPYRFFFNIILWKKVQIIKINGFNFLCVMQKLLLSHSILSQNFESVKSSEGFIFLVIQFHFPVHRSKTFSHRSGEARADYEDFPPTRRAFPREIWLMSLTLIDIARYKSLIEQSCSCTIRYFDRPDSFCDLVTWPTTISDDTLAFLFYICNIATF